MINEFGRVGSPPVHMYTHAHGLSLQTPFFMEKEMMAKTAQLEEFDEALYACKS